MEIEIAVFQDARAANELAKELRSDMAVLTDMASITLNVRNGAAGNVLVMERVPEKRESEILRALVKVLGEFL